MVGYKFDCVVEVPNTRQGTCGPNFMEVLETRHLSLFIEEVVLCNNLHVQIKSSILGQNRVQLTLRNGEVVGKVILVSHFCIVESFCRPDRLVSALTRGSTSEELSTGVEVDIGINLEFLVGRKHVR